MLPYDPAIPLPEIYPRELKTYVHTQTCTQMFIEALFITSLPKMEKSPKSSSMDESISKMCYSYAMEYYFAIKRSGALIHATTWMNFGTIMLRSKGPRIV